MTVKEIYSLTLHQWLLHLVHNLNVTDSAVAVLADLNIIAIFLHVTVFARTHAVCTSRCNFPLHAIILTPNYWCRTVVIPLHDSAPHVAFMPLGGWRTRAGIWGGWLYLCLTMFVWLCLFTFSSKLLRGHFVPNWVTSLMTMKYCCPCMLSVGQRPILCVPRSVIMEN